MSSSLAQPLYSTSVLSPPKSFTRFCIFICFFITSLSLNVSLLQVYSFENLRIYIKIVSVTKLFTLFCSQPGGERGAVSYIGLAFGK